MSRPLTPTEFHKQYDDTLSAFRRHITDAKERMLFSQEIDPFMRKCALGVWKAGRHSVSPAHVEYYDAIYNRETTPPSILYWELVSQVGDYPGFSVPPLFPRLCRYDRERGRDTARRFCYDFSLILLLFAAMDGSVSKQEASFIQHCADQLAIVCNQNELPEQGHALNLQDFVSCDAPNHDSPSASAPTPTQAEGPTEQAAQAEEAKEPTLEELLAELDELCGLHKVKEEVHSLINLVKVRKLREEMELPTPPMSLHMVFMGNPGTGKTTVARLLAGLYKAIGVLSQGQLVEVDRSGLVAGFVGQTALKTSEVIQKALGGILFIDEAYALANQDSGNDFGREAIEVLLKGMEDHRKDLVVIVAGYTGLMGKFISSNPGLESRFNKYLYFDDYTGEQLMEIFRTMCRKNSYTLPPKAEALAAGLFLELYEERDENFGNARDVRNVFEKAVSRQANRLASMETPSKEDLMAFVPADLEIPE